MDTSPWFTPLMTFAGVIFGGAVSIVTTWLTQRYNLRTQLAIKRAESEAAVMAGLRSEKEKRYIVILQNLDGLFATTRNANGKTEFLKAERELWLLGDQELLLKLNRFIVDIAGEKAADSREQLFGEVILEMRKGLGLTTDQLSNEDFRFHS